MAKSTSHSASKELPIEGIAERILVVRGQKVLMDADPTALYGAETKRLNEQVRRNSARFPEDFCFQMSREEYDYLRSQFATSNGRGGRRHLPYVFTEHGALMAAYVLNTVRAAEVSIYVVRAFVCLLQRVDSSSYVNYSSSIMNYRYSI